MKRWDDSRTIIPLISVILIMLAVIAMAGCVSTVLLSASYNGQADVVKDLLNKGADVNEKGSCVFLGDPDWTPLLCAVWKGNLEVVKVLIDRGADMNAKTFLGNLTPFTIAEKKGYNDIAKLLIEKRFNKEKQQSPRDGVSPTKLPAALPTALPPHMELPTVLPHSKEPAAPF